jgi:hypothetical protein
VDADGLVDLRDLGRDDGPKVRHVQARKDERFARLDEALSPGVLRHVARSRHERARLGGCVGVGDVCLQRKMEGTGVSHPPSESRRTMQPSATTSDTVRATTLSKRS